MHIQTRTGRAGQLVDGRPAVLEIHHHLFSHFRRESRHTLRRNTVIARKDDDLGG